MNISSIENYILFGGGLMIVRSAENVMYSDDDSAQLGKKLMQVHACNACDQSKIIGVIFFFFCCDRENVKKLFIFCVF